MNRPLITLALLLPSISLLAVEVGVHVTDESGADMAGAKVVIAFPHGRTSIDHKGITGEDGRFEASEQNTLGPDVIVGKECHYGQEYRGLWSEDHALEVVLRRKINPVPLRAKDVDIDVPEGAGVLGFDFTVGDLVAPYGSGTKADVLFKLKRNFLGNKFEGLRLDKSIATSKRLAAARKIEWTEDYYRYWHGHWEATLTVSFPGQGEGIVIEEDGYLKHGEMKMPHLAPEGGYAPTLEIEESTKTPSGARDDIGYFLRTRVTLDEDGEIQSAHYAKFGGDIRVNARGEIAFTYYFNPTSNDRNLEFDPAQNLFDSLEPDERVSDP